MQYGMPISKEKMRKKQNTRIGTGKTIRHMKFYDLYTENAVRIQRNSSRNIPICSRRQSSGMDDKTIQAIEAILKRGNDAEIRNKGDGVIVLEVKKTIKHST